MEHNSVVSGYPKSIGIPRVEGLSTGPLGFGESQGLTCPFPFVGLLIVTQPRF